MPDISFIENKDSKKIKSDQDDNQINWTDPSAKPDPSDGGASLASTLNAEQKTKDAKLSASTVPTPPAPSKNPASNNKPAPKPTQDNSQDLDLNFKEKPEEKKNLFALFKKKQHNNSTFKEQKAEIVKAKEEQKEDSLQQKPELDFKGDSGDGAEMKQLIKKKIKESNIQIGNEIVKTNLISGEDTIIIDWERNVIKLLGSIFLSILIVGSAYMYLDLNEQKETITSDDLDFEISSLERARDKARDGVKQVDIFQSNISKVKLLLDRHIYWTNFFKFLEEYTLKDIYYKDGINGTPDGVYNLSAVAPDFQSVTNQIAVFESNEFVRSAKVKSAKLTEEDDPDKGMLRYVEFILDLEIDPKIFIKQDQSQ